jgi:hypothetical protein
MTSQGIVREIKINDKEASRYFEYLEEFLGRDGTDSRLARVGKELNLETGAYLHYWVKPKNAVWLGLKESRRFITERIPFAGNLNSNMEISLELAAKLMTLTDSMPQQTITEFRSRLLGSDDISPIFFELNVASHFWQLGFDIEWVLPSTELRVKSPEFIARNNKFSIEVECKAKRPDAGRKIQRRSFYRLIDAISETISGHRFSGLINITIPKHMPKDNNSHDEILASIRTCLQNPLSKVELDSGIEILFDINRTNILMPVNAISTKIAKIRKPYSMVGAIFTQTQGMFATNPLIVCVDSLLPDRYMEGVFNTLREANHQFSGKSPSLICCFVPEIKSFVGMERDSAVAKMTEAFFIKHSNPCVFAVSYISDAQRDELGILISKSMPSLTFMNPNYDQNLGDVPSVYRG